jgi:hypothetical protein
LHCRAADVGIQATDGRRRLLDRIAEQPEKAVKSGKRGRRGKKMVHCHRNSRGSGAYLHGITMGLETLSIQREVIDMRLFILLSVLLLTACMTTPRGESPPEPPTASPSNGSGGTGGY